jgi:hypothetical protein
MMNRHLKLVLEVVFTALLAVGILLLYFSSAPGEKDGLAHADKKTADHGDEISDSGNHGIDVRPTQNSSRNDSSSSQEEKSKNWATVKEYVGNSSEKETEESAPAKSKIMQVSGVLDQGKPILPTLRENVAAGRTIQKILEGKDFSVPGVREQAVAEMRALEERQRTAVLAKAKELNVPLRVDGPGQNISELYDFRGDEPIYRKTLNVNAAISSRANLVSPAPYNLDGTGIRVGIWDEARVRTTHQELVGRVTIVDWRDSITNSVHATHVAGTVGASGVDTNAKGMAPKVNINSYDWDFDDSEMGRAGAASATESSKIPLSNHSYGSSSTTNDMGVYKTGAASKDEMAVVMPYYLIFWAAGNSRTASPNGEPALTSLDGYQSITYDALAKNIMTVGAVQDAVLGGERSLTNASMTYFSSWGPCDDGRIKPDVVANGSDVYSCSSSGDSSYTSYSGTSQATPSAMGSAALLVQLYAREFSGQRMRASTLKGLMIHTADDLGNAGPDYQYGWGLINVKAAADVILTHKADTNRPKLIEGALSRTTNEVITYTNNCTFVWNGVSPIRATLVWTDPAGSAATNTESRTPNLMRNLDLKIISPNGTTNLPYVMPFVGTWTPASMSLPATRGRNNVDNVEQVYLESPTVGTYTASVTVDTLSSGDKQIYSLIITGGEGGTINPPPSVSVTSPLNGASFAKGSSVTVSADASDLAYGGGVGDVSKLEFFVGGNKFAEGTTAPYSVSWTPSGSGTYVITAKATDNEGAQTTSAPISVTILNDSRAPVINSITVLAAKLRVPFQYQVTASDNPTSFTAEGLPPGLTCSLSGLISGTPTSLGPFASTVAASNSVGPGTISLNFLISSPTYLEWLVSYNLSELNVDQDSDGDGVKNLMEYFMGLDPKVQNSGSFVSVQRDGNSNFFSLTYRKSKEITGVVGAVEWSTDLASGNWSSDGITETSVDFGNYEERTASVLKAEGEVRKFLILRVTQP